MTPPAEPARVELDDPAAFLRWWRSRCQQTGSRLTTHALLYEPLRLAWARKTRIYVVNAEPAVRSTLELLENYALGG